MRSQGCVFRTALGWAGVAVSERGVAQVVLPRKDRRSVERMLGCGPGAAVRRGLLRKAVGVLTAYFEGTAVALDLPLDLGNATAFQQAAWKAAASIPLGATRSYAWIAERAGSPRAARAAGQAMGANPVPVLIP
jgi:O6-methylguanine-DNA--protein-cysteine methyltransferase